MHIPFNQVRSKRYLLGLNKNFLRSQPVHLFPCTLLASQMAQIGLILSFPMLHNDITAAKINKIACLKSFQQLKLRLSIASFSKLKLICSFHLTSILLPPYYSHINFKFNQNHPSLHWTKIHSFHSLYSILDYLLSFRE